MTDESPPSRRSARQAVPKATSVTSERSRRLENETRSGTRRLPDVQTRQSYAYGDNQTPALPEVLASQNKQSIQSMAGHIEDGQEDDDEEEDDDEDEDGISENPQDDSQLTDIPEEDSASEEAGPSSPPSNFPSELPDQSYNWERGLRRVRPALPPPQIPEAFSPFEGARETMSRIASRVVASTRTGSNAAITWLNAIATTTYHWLIKQAQAVYASMRRMPSPAIGAILAIVLGVVLALGVLTTTACFSYSRIGCDMIPTTGYGQSIHTGFQTICGDCRSLSGPIDLRNLTSADLSILSASLDGINKKIHDLERRLSYRIDSKHASLDSDLVSLKQQQAALTNHLADHVDSQSGPMGGNVASPLIPRINFFAPSNGAVVDPLRSSPTKDKLDTLFLRVLKRAVGVVKHQANPPSTALIAWHDVGDCWCASNVEAGDFIRLAVSTKEMLYPTELVIEHFPAAGNLDRSSTPRKLELWADFAHFNAEEWSQLQLSDMQEGNVLGPRYARIGTLKYDIAARGNHVQSSTLSVNQYGMLHYAKNFVLRITSNYGGDNVCLYRVRLHGQPIAAPEWGRTDDWYAQQGYAEDD